MAVLERVETVMWVLSNFDAVPNDSSLECCEASLCGDEIAEMREYLDARAVRAFDAYAAQQRIEDGINAILAHLGHPEAQGRESAPSTSRSAVTKAKGRGIEALIPPNPALEAKRPALTISIHDDSAATALVKTAKKPAGKKSSAKRSA